MTDELEFFQSIVERPAPIKTDQQEWTLHTMAPDQFCICPVCLDEARHVTSVLQIFPIVVEGGFRSVKPPMLIAAQYQPCGHWCTGLMWVRRSEKNRTLLGEKIRDGRYRS